MDNTQKIAIGITTTGDIGGAEEVRAALDKLVSATGTTTKSFSVVDATTARTKQSFDTMALSLVKTADKARVSEFAFYDLDASMRKTKNTTESFTAGATKVERASGNAGRSLLLFSQGFEDAQYGIRGVLNNIPGLVMSLGGAAGLAGGLSIAAVGFSILYDWLGQTEEKSADVEEKMEALATRIKTVTETRIETVKDRLSTAQEAAVSLRNDLALTKAADAEAATASLDNAEKYRKAQVAINELLGIRVNRITEITATAEAEAAERNLAAQQAVEAQQKRASEAQQAAADMRRKLTDSQQLAVSLNAELTLERERLAVLEANLRLTRKTASSPTMTAPNVFLPGGGMGFAPAQPRPDVEAILAARVEAETGNTEGLIAAQKGKLEALLKAYSDLVRNDIGSIARLETAVTQADNKATDTVAAVERSIETLQNSDAQAQVDAKVEELKAVQAQYAADVKETVGKFETNNEDGKAALANLRVAASDGAVTANELPDVARDLQRLVGLTQSGQAMFKGSLNELIGLQRDVNQEMASVQADIRALQSAMRTLRMKRPH